VKISLEDGNVHARNKVEFQLDAKLYPLGQLVTCDFVCLGFLRGMTAGGIFNPVDTLVVTRNLWIILLSFNVGKHISQNLRIYLGSRSMNTFF
jgi:hypothetical protein